MTIKQTYYLYFVVFVCGMTSLSIELSASRLLGNVFGTSNLVWACIIGLILIYLTFGYFLGGILADLRPQLSFLYILIAWSGISTGIVPLLSKPVLRLASDAFDQLYLGILFGSFVVVLILFILPVTILGMVSPFAIRLLVTNQQNAGKLSGRVYAISTLGSFLGTFLPVLILIPIIGTTKTFIVFSYLLLLVALIGIGSSSGVKVLIKWIWMLVILIIISILGVEGSIKNTNGQIFEKESAYNYIQVIEQDGYRYLRLNEGQGIHSMWHPTEINFNGPWQQFLVAPFFNPPKGQQGIDPESVDSYAIIGLAAGTSARQAMEVFSNIQIDGYEIDPDIISIGKQYFGMDLPRLNPIASDGRWGLEHSDRLYEIIGVDAYRPPYIPWHLTTVEFFELVWKRLEPDGVMVINVGRAPEDRRLVEGLVGTIQVVFPSLYVMDVPDTFNSIIYATKLPTDITNLYKNMLYLMTREDVHPLLLGAIQKAIVYQQPIPVTKTVFTDDLAPVEWITNSLILNYILSGDMEGVQ